MTPRRRVPKRASPQRERSRNGADPVAVLLEDLRSQMKVVIEVVQECATKTELETLRADTQRGFNAMNVRFDVLTGEVARKAEGAALGALERRVAALEHRSGA